MLTVAFAGKGGAGKTTIAATLARVVAARGTAVVAVDADSNPNLGAALGLTGASRRPSLPPEVVSRRPGDGRRLSEPVAAVLERYAEDAPDGVRLLRMGQPEHAGTGCLCAEHAAVEAVLADLARAGEDRPLAVVDLEATPEHLTRGTVRHADVMLVVAEPYFRSLEAARRLAELAGELDVEVAVVANKLRNDVDRRALTEFCARHRLAQLAAFDWDEKVVAADSAGVALVDLDKDAPTVRGAAALAESLVRREAAC